MRRSSAALLLCALLSIPAIAGVVRNPDSTFGVICSWAGFSGRSNRSRHEADLSEYAGGPVRVKFTGSDQQLSELVLATESL